MNTNKKIKLEIIKVIVILLIIGIIVVCKYIKDYNTYLGSSEKLFNYNTYKTSVRIKNDKIDTILLIDKNKKISNLVLLSPNTYILYNKNIENKNIKESINKICSLFNRNKYLSSDIKIITYNSTKIKGQITKEIENFITKENLNIKVIEKYSTIEKLREEYNINASSEKEIIENIYYNAMDRLSNYKKLDKRENTSQNMKNYKNYADNVYEKLTKYQSENNIKNKSIKDNNVEINLIPANKDANIYPDKESWYYIKDYKIYAYIKFKEDDIEKDFCYNGSIDNYKEGVCK